MDFKEKVTERGQFLAQQRANVIRIFGNIEGAIAENNEVLKLLEAHERDEATGGAPEGSQADVPKPSPEPAPFAEGK